MFRACSLRCLALAMLLLVAASRERASAADSATAPPPPAGRENAADLLAKSIALEGSDTPQALALAGQALQLSREQPRHTDELPALLQVARMTRFLNDYTGTAAAVDEGLKLATAARNPRMRAEFLLVQGTAEWNQGNLSPATEHLVESLRIAEELDDKRLLLRVHARMGLVRGRYDDPAGELSHLQTALDLVPLVNDPAETASVLNYLGNYYMNAREYDLARTQFERALELVRDGADQRIIAFLFINLGEIATDMGDQVQARKYLDDAMAICQRCHNQRGIADAHYLLAAVDRRTGHIEDALSHLSSALGIAEAIKNPDLLVSVYDEFVRSEEARGGYRAAVDYARKLEQQRQIMRNETSQRRAVEIQSQYEAEARARKIQLLQRDKDLQKTALALASAELNTTRTQYGILTLVLCSALASLFWRQRFQVRVSRRSLAESQAAKERAEQDLRESEVRFRSAFEHSALGFALVAPDGRWLRVNHALCEVLGYSEEELLAANFQNITHPADLEGDLRLAGQVLSGELQSYHLEKRYIHKAGHEVWAWLDVSLVRDEQGQPRYFISQVQDITERKRAAEALHAAKEEAERANNAKSEFLSRTSHELRTPLNAIIGFGQLLEIDELNPRQQQSVDHVMTAARHLLGLINDVLDMARIENGNMDLKLEPVCVAAAVRETLELVDPLAAQVAVRLKPAHGEENAHVAADPRRLRQILLNLLSNAIKFNRALGEVAISWRTTDDGARVRIDVADNGVGMSLEDCERIFAPFTRLPASEQVEGTGLGLPLARSLAEGMGGTISARSALAEGSVFTIELAAEAEPAPTVFSELGDEPECAATMPVERALTPSIAWAVEGTLLYIEDNLANLQLVERLVEDHAPGLRLVSAMQGRLGLDLALETRPDFVLLDLNLPDMTGAEVLRALRQHPATASVPVIVISADATPGQMRRLRMLGACEYLTKPFVLGDLLRALEEAVHARALV